jgi:hypothetical protein
MDSHDAVGPSIAPCQQEAVTKYTLLFLFLTAIRAFTERGGLEEQTAGGQGDTSPPQEIPICI